MNAMSELALEYGCGEATIWRAFTVTPWGTADATFVSCGRKFSVVIWFRGRTPEGTLSSWGF